MTRLLQLPHLALLVGAVVVGLPVYFWRTR
jgi:hypothetical protein